MTDCGAGIHGSIGVAGKSCVVLAGTAAARGGLRQLRAALLAGTALSVGLLALSGQAAADSECGNANVQTTTACGSGPFPNGVTYDNNDTQGPEIFVFNNSQVTGGGVLLTTNQNGETIFVEINQVGAGPAPSITNGASLNADAGLDVRTTGNNAGITINHNAGTITGGGGIIATHDGISASTTGSNSPIVLNTAAGTIVSATTGDGIELNASGGSDITANINGTVNSSTGLGLGIGLTANATGGNGNVGINLGSTAAISGEIAGINASSEGAGNVTINSSGAVTATGVPGFIPIIGDLGFGIIGTADGSGNVSITTHAGGTVAANSPLGFGVLGMANSGNVAISTGDSVTAGAVGLLGFSQSGNASVTAGGSITAAPGGSAIAGIGAISGSGSASATANADISGFEIGAGSLVLGGGLNASVGAGDGVTVNANSVGLLGLNLGTGNVAINAHPNSTINSDGIGIAGAALNGGNVTINSGAVNAAGSGVIGFSLGGDVVTSNYEKIDASGLVGLAAISLGGSATVNVNADIDPPLIGAAAATLGAGTALVNVADGVSVEADLIGALGFNLGDGMVDVHVGNGSSVTSTTGGFGIGIAALDIGAGGIHVDVGQGSQVLGDTFGIASLGIGTGDTSIGVGSGTVVASNTGGFGVGIGATSLGSGNIDVNLVAGTEADPTRVLGDTIGIGALSIGSGDIFVHVGSNARVVSDSGGLGIGIAAAAFGSGNVDINLAQNGVVFADTTAIAAIATDLGGGSNTVTIENAGLIQGNGGTFIPVIFAASDAGIDVTNSGRIRGSLGDTNPDGSLVDGGARLENIMLGISGGSIDITNTGGRMIGNVALLSGAGNTVSLDAQSRWDTGGFNVIGLDGDDTILNAGLITTGQPFTVFFFGDGDDLLVNTGRIAANNVTAFIGLNNFDNAGALDMQDGDVNDVVFTTGNFNGLTGSQLHIDARLNGPAGPGEAADLLAVGGDVTGRTALFVNDLLAGNPGSFNPDGVVFAVVGGETQQNNFFLANGPIDKGLFSYDTFLRPDVEDSKDWWVLASRPDQTFFELPSILSAAQSLWYSSTGVWLDRTADLRAAQDVCMPGGLKDEVVCVPGVRPGVWAKAFGSWSERSQDHRFSQHDRRFRHEVEYDQDSFGIIGGVDFSPGALPAGQGGWLLGVMAGYINSNQDFDRSTTEVDIEGALVGGYATYLRGGLFVDAQIAANLGEVSYDSFAPGLVAKDDADLRSIGGIIDTGYRFPVSPSGAFIEPGATLAYVNSNVDDLRIFGTRVDFQDGDSLRGRLGVRLGLSSMWASYKFEPFVGASAWYEFMGDNEVAVVSGGLPLKAEDDVSGWIGEVTGGVNLIQIGSAGVSGFAKGNYQFGEDDYQSFTGQVGVRYQW